MEALLIAVVGVVVVALATALAPRVGIAGPLALVAIGIGVSLLPFFPAFEVDPEIMWDYPTIRTLAAQLIELGAR